MDIQKFTRETYKLLLDKFNVYRLLNDLPSIDINDSDKLIVFSHCGPGRYEKIYLLVAHALSKKGYPCVFLFKEDPLYEFSPGLKNFINKIGCDGRTLFKRYMFHPHFPDLQIDGQDLNNSLRQVMPFVFVSDDTKRDLHYQWKIDLDNQEIKTKGINFYTNILQTLRRFYKKYNIDFQNQHVLSIMEKMIDTCDLLFYYFDLLKKHANETNTQIRIVGHHPQYIPNCIFRHLCEQFSEKRDIEFIALHGGVPQYFGLHPRAPYFTIINLTHLKRCNSMTITREEFQNHNTYESQSIKKRFDRSLKTSRPLTKNQQVIVDKTKNYDRTFVLFTHVFFDVYNDPYTPNPVYTDMCEWILDTIKYFNEHEDLLLFLKPHPSEINMEHPVKTPSETLKDFINHSSINLNKNVILLPSRLFTLGELLPYFDCGLILKSFVGFELTYMKKPCIIVGFPYYAEALSNLNYAKSKKHYFSLIENTDRVMATDEQKQDAIKYLGLWKQEQVLLKEFRFDDLLKTVFWDSKNLKKYIYKGDNNINKLINKILK